MLKEGLGLAVLIVGGLAVNSWVQANGGWGHASELAAVITSQASCEPQGVAIEDHIYTDSNGDPDFGYRVTIKLKNTAKTGLVWNVVTLTTEEGAWNKDFMVTLDGGDTKAWFVEFPEPTIASLDHSKVHANLECRPGRDKAH